MFCGCDSLAPKSTLQGKKCHVMCHASVPLVYVPAKPPRVPFAKHRRSWWGLSPDLATAQSKWKLPLNPKIKHEPSVRQGSTCRIYIHLQTPDFYI